MALTSQPIPVSNFTATAAPTVNDDSTAGYSVGSEWADETNLAYYVCTDPTAGAAVWVQVTAGASDQNILANQIFGP